VDSWPITPPRPRPQQQQTREPADEPAEEGGMMFETEFETESAANAAQHAVSNTVEEDRGSTRHSETTNQVNDFLSSQAGSNYTSKEESDDDIPDEKQVDLGNVYSQCRAAREAAFVSTVVDISCNENMLGTETKKWDRIGTLDKQLDSEIKDYFKERIEKNGVTVNQFLSCSFDPSTLLCITCDREHKVLEGERGPDCFAVTDQNFIGTLPGTDQKKMPAHFAD